MYFKGNVGKVGLWTSNSVLREAVREGGVDSFDENVVPGRPVVDIRYFTRVGVLTIEISHLCRAGWLDIAQNCGVHLSSRLVVNKIANDIVDHHKV